MDVKITKNTTAIHSWSLKHVFQLTQIFFMASIILFSSGCTKDSLVSSGLTHKAIGNAALDGADKYLFVKNISGIKKNGVSVFLNQSRSWSSYLVSEIGNKGSITLEALGNTKGQPTESEAKMQISVEGDVFKLSAAFDHELHDVEIYDHDTLITTIRGVSAANFTTISCETVPEFFENCPRSIFGIPNFRQNTGLICEWNLAFTESRSFITSSGAFSGNRIKFIEHAPDNYSPKKMSFDYINITATNVEYFILSNQSVVKSNE